MDDHSEKSTEDIVADAPHPCQMAAACKDCHTQRINQAPAFNHAYAPTCGFCHVQGLPSVAPATGRVR